MIKPHNSSVLIFLLLLVFSCHNPVQLPEENKRKFDVEKYFSGEVAFLKSKNAGITKVIVKDNKSEKIIIEQTDWQMELQPFFLIKLNKPAQVNSFSVDTIMNGRKSIVTYYAKDESEELRKLIIYSTEEKYDSIIAIKGASNLYYTSADTISYLGNGNYRIITRNKPRIGKEMSFVLEGFPNF